MLSATQWMLAFWCLISPPAIAYTVFSLTRKWLSRRRVRRITAGYGRG